ncbi:hypothetical protein LWI28_028690 [Acer negundo]|uniref:Transposase MuDR plant domain-containing protein n=1 Tax=Acer negundo TaxID=4023 RepID=A0AAD5I8I4_ACENE|nr:hypothetical protein LWI28_028690 [Acer negundo]
MNRVRIVISYNGRWEQLPDGSQRFVGFDNQGMYMSKNMTYEELVAIVHTIVKYDRIAGDVIGNDIPPPENTQQFGSFSGRNQVYPQKSFAKSGENMCGVLPVAVDQVVEPQFGDMFGCRIEQYNEMNNYPNHEVDNEANNKQVNDLENVDEEPTQIQTQGRHVQGVSCTVPNMHGISKVRHNITVFDSDNTITWVILKADSYSFGIGRSSTLATQEPTCLIYKGPFFSSKKDLKRLVGLFSMRENFEWKVKRSNKTTLHLVCIIDDCTWKLRAMRRDEGTYFQVRSFVN